MANQSIKNAFERMWLHITNKFETKETVAALDERIVDLEQNGVGGGGADSGVGKDSYVRGEQSEANGDNSFAHGYKAIAETKDSVAIGKETISGGTVHYYCAIDTESRKIYLCDEQYQTPVIGDTATVNNFINNINIATSNVYNSYISPSSTEEYVELDNIYINVNNIDPFIYEIVYTGEGELNGVKYITYQNDLSFSSLKVRDGDLLPIDYSIGFPQLPLICTQPIFTNAFAEGYKTHAFAYSTHAEGSNTIAMAEHAHAEGLNSIAGYVAHSEGQNTKALGKWSHSEGYGTKALGEFSHSSGWQTEASGKGANSEGYSTKAIGAFAHAEGRDTIAEGTNSHAEGLTTKALKDNSHAEGRETVADAAASHVEGYSTKTFGDYSHAEGRGTEAHGQFSHAQGYNNKAIGQASHASGRDCEANVAYSLVSGYGLKSPANRSTHYGQAIVGKYNDNSSTAMFMVGAGSSDTDRVNAFEASLDPNGKSYIKVGNTS